jgi:hypothetical protein
MAVFSTSSVMKRAVETADRVSSSVYKEGTNLLWIGDIYLMAKQGIDKSPKWSTNYLGW